ncbi:MAG TPA: tRNA lysidine(34) synthetase TilS [Solirubrobacteraceae bacterium]
MVCEDVREAVAASGLFARDRPVVAMLSGGRDSNCLLDVAVALLGAASLSALHVNYGLRADADGDEQHCVALCEQLGVELEIVRAGPAPGGRSLEHAATDLLETEITAGEDRPTGNLQAWARDLRYAEAMRLAQQRDALVATGHTADDQLETILYRLAASPGRRALLGMPASEGRLIRPLLAVSREQTSAYCQARALGWREDESNQDERYARARVRGRLVPALLTVHPAAAANVLRTASLLREETELLEGLVSAELAGRRSIAVARLGELPSALARLVVVRLAEEAAGTYVPQAGERVQEIIALGRRGRRAELHVGGQAGAVICDGVLEMIKLEPRE